MPLDGTPYRCSSCNKFLLAIYDFQGLVRVPCDRCGTENWCRGELESSESEQRRKSAAAQWLRERREKSSIRRTDRRSAHRLAEEKRREIGEVIRAERANRLLSIMEERWTMLAGKASRQQRLI